jgi:hypothetical protein
LHLQPGNPVLFVFFDGFKKDTEYLYFGLEEKAWGMMRPQCAALGIPAVLRYEIRFE